MAVVIAAASFAAGCGDSPKPGLSVTPTSPGPTSSLRFAFTAPASSGRANGIQTAYTLSVNGPDRRGCASVRADALPAIKKDEHVNVTVSPPAHGRWCTGAFVAQVQELAKPVCAPGAPCPQFVRVVARVGRVRFTIKG